MTEINNNIPNFGFGTKKVEAKKQEKAQVEHTNETNDKNQGKYILDTGVIGRSQVDVKGDMTKSIDEAVALARTNPLLLGCSESFFDAAYTNFQTQGMNADDAYYNALMAENEFMGLARANI